MATATVTSKGQITIPVEIRNLLDLKPGDKVHFVAGNGREVRLYAKNRSIKELKGIFGPFPRTISIEEMNNAIAERASERDRRSRS